MEEETKKIYLSFIRAENILLVCVDKNIEGAEAVQQRKEGYARSYLS